MQLSVARLGRPRQRPWQNLPRKRGCESSDVLVVPVSHVLPRGKVEDASLPEGQSVRFFRHRNVQRACLGRAGAASASLLNRRNTGSALSRHRKKVVLQVKSDDFDVKRVGQKATLGKEDIMGDANLPMSGSSLTTT